MKKSVLLLLIFVFCNHILVAQTWNQVMKNVAGDRDEGDYIIVGAYNEE